MSFERPNLHFSVHRKQGGLASNFGQLLEAGEKGHRQAGGQAGSLPLSVQRLNGCCQAWAA